MPDAAHTERNTSLVPHPSRNGYAPRGAQRAGRPGLTDPETALLTAAVAAAPTPVALFTGSDHQLGYLNASGRDVFGPRPLSEPVDHALPEFVDLGIAGILDQVARTGVSVTVPPVAASVFQGGRDDGGQPWHLMFVCSAVWDVVVPGASEPVSGVMVVGVDVTDHVTANAALREGARRHRYAAVTLQRSLLPQRLPQPDEVRISGCYLPGAGDDGEAGALQVGGDWYDVIALGAGRTGLVIGDVMGRGLRAAAVMGQLRAALHAYATQNLPPGEVLHHLDRHTAGLDSAGGSLATVFYGVFDPVEQSLSYASAGHLPALLRLPDGMVCDLDAAGGPPLGTGEWSWQEACVAMPPESCLVMFTDGLLVGGGVPRRADPDHEAGLSAVRRLLAEAPMPRTRLVPRPGDAGMRRTGAADAVRDHLLGGVDLPPDHSDDVALLVMHVPAWSGPRAELFRSAAIDLVGGPEIAAHARAFASGVLSSWHIAEELCEAGVLAVSELVANAVTHGLPPVRLRLRRTDRRLVVDVCDGDDHLPRRRLAEDYDETGRGIGIVAALATGWGSRSTPDGKSVWCEFSLV